MGGGKRGGEAVWQTREKRSKKDRESERKYRMDENLGNFISLDRDNPGSERR